MAYIGNQPSPSNVTSAGIQDGTIKNVDIAADAAIEISKLDGVTATNTELNKLDGVTASTADLNVLSGAVAAGVTSTELQHLGGVTSNIQTQINTALGGATKGTLTKSFVTGETATIALSSASTPTASVFVTKEIPQVGVTNGDWNVNVNDSGYDIEDFAYNEDLTIDTVNSTATLATSPWSANDVGKKIVGGGGEASLVDTTGTIQISVPFSTSNPTLTAGSWNFYGIVFANTGVSLARGDGNVTTSFDIRDDFKYNTTQALNFDTAFTGMTAQKFRLSPDGTKLFILNTSGGLLYAKTLSTPFNITSVSGTMETYDPTNTANAADFFFSSDGLKLFMLNTGESVEEYTLATPYSISSATFSTTQSISAIVTTAASFTFSADGENMLVLDSTTDRVHQYNLSTAWDLSTLTYAAKSAYVGSQDPSVATEVSWTETYQIELKPDFSEIYVSTDNYRTADDGLSAAEDFRIHTFRMQTVGDIGTIKYVPRSMDALSFPFTITENGRSVITTDRITSIYKWGLGTAYALGDTSFFRTADVTPDYVTQSLFGYSLLSGETWRGTFMSPNGKFVLGLMTTSTLNFVFLVRLDIPYDLGSKTTLLVNKLNYSTNSTAGLGAFAFWSADSSTYFLNIATSATIRGYVINETGGAVTNYTFTTDANFYFGNFAMSLDGLRLYVTGGSVLTRNTIYQFNLPSANSINGASIILGAEASSFTATSDALSLASVDASFTIINSPIVISNNKIAINASTQGTIVYTLSDPSSVSTAYIADFKDVSGFDQGITLTLSSVFSADGQRVFRGGSALLENNLQGAYQITGKVSQQKTLLNTAAEASTINADETKAYQFESTTGLITEMTLGTKPFTYYQKAATGATFSATTHDSTPQDILFSADGSKLFVVGNDTDAIYSYPTPTAFDLSTTTTLGYDSYAFGEDTDVRSAAFSSDGLKLFMLGNANKTVYQYTLTTAYDLSTVSYDSVSLDLQVFPSPLEAVDAIALSSDNKTLFLAGTITEETNNALSQHIIASFTLSTAKSLVGASLDKFSPMYSIKSLSFNNEGTRYYTQNFVMSAEGSYANASVTPLNQNLAAVTNSVNRIDTQYWTDINSMAALNTFNNSGAVYFAVSLDAQATFKVASNDNGIRTIVRNNAGTWEYNSNTTYGSETWVAASTNSKFGALNQALNVTANQMGRTQLGAVSDFNHFTVADTLDLAIILRQDVEGTPPISDGVSINYDAQALNKGAILGTDYDYDVPTSTSVRITSLKDQNLKVKVV